MKTRAWALSLAFAACSTSESKDTGTVADEDARVADAQAAADASSREDGSVDDATVAHDSGSTGDASNTDASDDTDSGIEPIATAEEVKVAAEAASESATLSTVISAVIAEVAGDQVAGPALGFPLFPEGGVHDRARDLGVTLQGECGGVGTESLDRCPAVFTCQDRTVLAYGRGCTTSSGRKISGTIRIDQAGSTWSFGDGLFPLAVEGNDGRIAIRGQLNAVSSNERILFNQAAEPLLVRLPAGPRLAQDREHRVRFDDISIQVENGSLVVRGPHTFVLEDVPIDCNGSPTTIDLTVEDCGGWSWGTPLSSCMCPSAGELRVIGPLLDPCGDPTSSQTMVVQFQSLETAACGQNMTAQLYGPSTQCESGCGTCDPGTCFRGVCTNMVDVSSVASEMVGWICELPETSCEALEDAGISCGDASVRDVGVGDGSINLDGAIRPDGSINFDGAINLDGATNLDASVNRDGSLIDRDGSLLDRDGSALPDGAVRPDGSFPDVGLPVDAGLALDASLGDGAGLGDGSLLDRDAGPRPDAMPPDARFGLDR